MVTVRVQPLAFLKENCTKLISYCMYVLGIVILWVPGTHFFVAPCKEQAEGATI